MRHIRSTCIHVVWNVVAAAAAAAVGFVLHATCMADDWLGKVGQGEKYQ